MLIWLGLYAHMDISLNAHVHHSLTVFFSLFFYVAFHYSQLASISNQCANELPQCSQCYGFLISVAVLSVPNGPCPSALSCHPSPIPFVCLSFTYMHRPHISQWLVNCTCGEVNGWWYGGVEVQSTCLLPKYPPGPLSSRTLGGHSEYAPQAKKIHCAVWSDQYN